MQRVDQAKAFPSELGVVWLLFVLDGVAIFVTYSRSPAHELYHVSGSGLTGGASRVFVFSNFPTSLVAIALLALLADRIGGRLPAAVAAVGVALCLATTWPGVVDQANLDAKPVNTIAAAGVLVAAALTTGALWRLGPPASAGRRPGDRARMLGGAAVVFLGLPWLAAELGFYLNGVPLLGRLFQTGEYLQRVPGLPPFPPAVHHGHHHGFDGVLLTLSVLLLSRVVPSVRDARLRVAAGLYLALMLCYAVGNIANDFWIEQINKRGWTTWHFPDVLRPDLTVAWGLIVAGAAVVYTGSVWWTRTSEKRGLECSC